jgi:hypothetical protein
LDNSHVARQCPLKFVGSIENGYAFTSQAPAQGKESGR